MFISGVCTRSFAPCGIFTIQARWTFLFSEVIVGNSLPLWVTTATGAKLKLLLQHFFDLADLMFNNKWHLVMLSKYQSALKFTMNPFC